MARRQLDSATRARRLLALLPHLRKGDRVPLDELAHAVGCSAEEVAADLTTLTMCGIPPFSPLELVGLDIDGDAVSVYMDPPGLQRPLKLTVAEARAINAALDVAGYAADSPLRQRLQEACAGSVSLDDLERTVRAGTAPGGMAETYAALAAAAEDHEKVRIVYYTGATGRVAERVVHPWALVQRLGVWYLIAWCEAAGQERVFRLDRIRDIERLGVTFAPPSGVSTAVTPDISTLPCARVIFAPGTELPDDRQWPGATYEQQPDGSTAVCIPYQSPSWVARRVSAFLGKAEVVEPAEVREAVHVLAADLLRAVQ